MSLDLRVTVQTFAVLRALDAGYHHGFDIMDVTDLPSGTVYPILRRLEEHGLVRSRWESGADAQREQRPRRRYYSLTRPGEEVLAEAASRFRSLERLPARRPRPAGVRR